MRAKFELKKVNTFNGYNNHNPNYEELEFLAVITAPFDKDGNSEDNSFTRWTPDGSLKMSVTNPNLIGKFKEGQKFYLDFIPAE